MKEFVGKALNTPTSRCDVVWPQGRALSLMVARNSFAALTSAIPYLSDLPSLGPRLLHLEQSANAASRLRGVGRLFDCSAK